MLLRGLVVLLVLSAAARLARIASLSFVSDSYANAVPSLRGAEYLASKAGLASFSSPVWR